VQVEIYCDDLQEGKWFASLSPYLAQARLLSIGSRGSNVPLLERLLRYDRPDIILVIDKQPKLVVEKTSEVPTGHNIGQRFGRMVNAVEENVAVVYFLPFKAMKHGRYANVCYVNARLFEAFRKMEEIHKVPVLAINWPCDNNYELIRGGSEDSQIGQFVGELFRASFDYEKVPIISQIRNRMREEYEERIEETPGYRNPPPTVKIVKTSHFVKSISDKVVQEKELPKAFLARAETVTYRFDMTPEYCRREDPYTGTQFIYDYIWCRNGPHPSDKFRNLVLMAPLVSRRRWVEANPNDPGRKSSLYYVTANMIVLSDGIIICTRPKSDPQRQSTLNRLTTGEKHTN
jgi:hypothetical protein